MATGDARRYVLEGETYSMRDLMVLLSGWRPALRTVMALGVGRAADIDLDGIRLGVKRVA